MLDQEVGRKMNTTITTCFFLLLALCVTGCSQPAEPPPPQQQRVALEIIGRIGCGDCNDARQITPWALAILDGERIAVLDRYEPLVRVFDTGGQLLNGYGARGEGPGELGQELPPAGYLPGWLLFGNELGGITVLDIFPASLEAFDGDGEFVRRAEPGLSDTVPLGHAFDPETRTYYRVSFSPFEADRARRISRCSFATIDASSCEVFADPAAFLAPEGSPGDALGDLVLAATPQGELVVANAGSYDLWWLDAQGETVARSGRDLPVPRKSEAEIEQERSRGRPDRPIDPNRPHLTSYGLQVDGDDRVWGLTGRHAEADSVFDIFAPDGTFLDEVRIDAIVRRSETSMMPFTARGDLLAAVAQVASGDAEVRVYRVQAR